MSEWQPIETLPDRPMMVLTFARDLVFYEYKTRKPITLPSHDEPWRDGRIGVAFFDGEYFCELFSGHEIFEFDHDIGAPENPTHWMPAPEPPK